MVTCDAGVGDKPEPVKKWVAHGGGVTWLQFAADGGVVSIGRDKKAKKWDGNGQLLMDFPPFPDIGTRVCITGDGQRVFGGDWTGAIRGWRVEAVPPDVELISNPPTIESRLASAEHLLVAAEMELASCQDRQQTLDIAEASAQQAWNDVLDQLAAAETKARAIATLIREAKTLQEHDEVS